MPTDSDAQQFMQIAAQIMLRNTNQLGITPVEGSLLREYANASTEDSFGVVLMILFAIMYSLFA